MEIEHKKVGEAIEAIPQWTMSVVCKCGQRFYGMADMRAAATDNAMEQLNAHLGYERLKANSEMAKVTGGD